MQGAAGSSLPLGDPLGPRRPLRPSNTNYYSVVWHGQPPGRRKNCPMKAVLP